MQNNRNEFPVPFGVWIAPSDVNDIAALYDPQYNTNTHRGKQTVR